MSVKCPACSENMVAVTRPSDSQQGFSFYECLSAVCCLHRHPMEIHTVDAVNARCEREVDVAERKFLDGVVERFLMWRGIDIQMGDKPCPKCGGVGHRAYGNTSTWRGGIGGQMITDGICDECWGSGNAAKPWTNLRELRVARDAAAQLEAWYKTFGTTQLTHAIAERERLQGRLAEAEDSVLFTKDWYGSRWREMSRWLRSPEMEGTEVARRWFNVVANGVADVHPPEQFMAGVNLDRYRLARAEKLLRRIYDANYEGEAFDDLADFVNPSEEKR